MQNQLRHAALGISISILTCIAAFLVVPEVRSILSLPNSVNISIAITDVAVTSSSATPTTQTPLSISNEFPTIVESIDGIPEETKLSIVVDQNMLDALTAGPLCVYDFCFQGGEQRGTVIVMLPNSTPYEITSLVPTQNWHGSYLGSVELAEVLKDERVVAMLRPGSGNCTGTLDCLVIDWAIIGPSGILDQGTEYSK